MRSDVGGGERGAGSLHHRPHRPLQVAGLAQVLGFENLADDALDGRPHPLQLLGLGHERDHHLDHGMASGPHTARSSLKKCPRLHLVQPGLVEAEPAPAEAEHRVGLPP